MRTADAELMSTAALPDGAMSDVDEPFAIADALVKVTMRKLVRGWTAQVLVQSSGASVIHSAELCGGGGDGSGTDVWNDQPRVEFVSVKRIRPLTGARLGVIRFVGRGDQEQSLRIEKTAGFYQ